MRYLSVCSGIEAASVAWKPLGWEAEALSEIDGPPSAVLKHHYPDVPNLGDMRRFKGWKLGTVDLLVGGTPCQSFSVAGLRKGLADPRGNLALVFLAILDRVRPRWVVWENVPGVLSVDGGRTFGAFVGGLGQLGYGWAYRTLDAQHFGVPQRRRRVFVVGHLGDARRAAAVLFERASLSGDSPPVRRAGEGFAADVAPSLTASGRGVERTGESRGQDPVVAGTLGASGAGTARTSGNENQKDFLIPSVSHALGARGGAGRQNPEQETFLIQDARTMNRSQNGVGVSGKDVSYTLDGNGAQAIAFPGSLSGTQRVAARDVSPSIGARNPVALAFESRIARNGRGAPDEVAPPLKAESGRDGRGDGEPLVFKPSHFTRGKDSGPSDLMAPLSADADKGDQDPVLFERRGVRRLTPIEAERLQGFPDDYTLVRHRGAQMKDGPRYRMLGNSMAVPVMAWIGRRISLVDAVPPVGKK